MDSNQSSTSSDQLAGHAWPRDLLVDCGSFMRCRWWCWLAGPHVVSATGLNLGVAVESVRRNNEVQPPQFWTRSK